MLVSIKHHLAYLAVPKTGSTAIEQALAPLCDLRFMRPHAKHLDMRTFERFVLPYLRPCGRGVGRDGLRDPRALGQARELVPLPQPRQARRHAEEHPGDEFRRVH